MHTIRCAERAIVLPQWHSSNLWLAISSSLSRDPSAPHVCMPRLLSTHREVVADTVHERPTKRGVGCAICSPAHHPLDIELA